MTLAKAIRFLGMEDWDFVSFSSYSRTIEIPFYLRCVQVRHLKKYFDMSKIEVFKVIPDFGYDGEFYGYKMIVRFNCEYPKCKWY